jgi:hypothetical protein
MCSRRCVSSVCSRIRTVPLADDVCTGSNVSDDLPASTRWLQDILSSHHSARTIFPAVPSNRIGHLHTHTPCYSPYIVPSPRHISGLMSPLR